MKILIIEDEPFVAVSLAKIVREIEPGVEILGPLGSITDTREWLSKNSPPDLILSDIQLADGISLDIFSGEKIFCPIIFTTAYNEYAIKAFKLNSIDYLLKPIDKNELGAAFDKFHLLQSKFGNKLYVAQLKELFASFSEQKKFKERFTVHSGKSVSLISVDKIAMFIKEEIIFLILNDGSKFITDFRSLDEIEEMTDPKIFFRANRQHLIHIRSIKSYQSDDTGKIIVKTNNVKIGEVLISKERAAEFRRWFE
ncbi:MAG TPA: DNA-binding response regulator [Cytophagales bacterium]|jgi:two-component system, LytTR family, response regulator|nr:DNA-binding response regulator [Cytophagales bacterium]